MIRSDLFSIKEVSVVITINAKVISWVEMSSLFQVTELNLAKLELYNYY